LNIEVPTEMEKSAEGFGSFLEELVDDEKRESPEKPVDR
jgi:hypothetical protein